MTILIVIITVVTAAGSDLVTVLVPHEIWILVACQCSLGFKFEVSFQINSISCDSSSSSSSSSSSTCMSSINVPYEPCVKSLIFQLPVNRLAPSVLITNICVWHDGRGEMMWDRCGQQTVTAGVPSAVWVSAWKVRWSWCWSMWPRPPPPGDVQPPQGTRWGRWRELWPWMFFTN